MKLSKDSLFRVEPCFRDKNLPRFAANCAVATPNSSSAALKGGFSALFCALSTLVNLQQLSIGLDQGCLSHKLARHA